MKPVLKWVGGKSKIVYKIIDLFPYDFNTYWEPFVGGASVAIGCFDKFPQKTLQLSDINNDLINFYNCLKVNLIKLISILDSIEIAWNKSQNKLETYLRLRNFFNKTKHAYAYKRAAIFYFLNKTSFNGVIRYNSKGEFNVPFGKRDFIVDREKIFNFASFVSNNKVWLRCGSFLDIRPIAKDLVYFDPPYHPISNTSSFTGYHTIKWSNDEEIKLKNKIDELTNEGVYVIMSNNDVSFIRDLFSGYKMTTLDVMKSVGAKKSTRKTTSELLIWNF